MSYVYLKSQGEECYTVGFYGPVGEDWHAESDHPTSEEAARRVHWLNGGSDHTGGSDHMVQRLLLAADRLAKKMHFEDHQAGLPHCAELHDMRDVITRFRKRES